MIHEKFLITLSNLFQVDVFILEAQAELLFKIFIFIFGLTIIFGVGIDKMIFNKLKGLQLAGNGMH